MIIKSILRTAYYFNSVVYKLPSLYPTRNILYSLSNDIGSLQVKKL